MIRRPRRERETRDSEKDKSTRRLGTVREETWDRVMQDRVRNPRREKYEIERESPGIEGNWGDRSTDLE